MNRGVSRQIVAVSKKSRRSTEGYSPSRRGAPLRLGLIGASLIGVGLLSAGAGALLALLTASQFAGESAAKHPLTTLLAKPLPARLKVGLPELDQPLNVLVLGTKVLTSDLAEAPPTDPGYQALVNSLDGLADTMLLLRLDPTTQQVSVLSIPRDTRTWIQERGYAKINEANALGGADLSAETVSDLLGGVPIDRYVRINVQGIEKLVDALGGINLYVPKPMKYEDHSQHLYIDLESGQQHLDGNQTLQFLRYRYDEWGDIGRIQRQQSLIRAFREQALNPLNLVRLPQVFSVLHSHMDTNLSLKEWTAIAGFMANQEQSNLEMIMLPGSFSNTDKDPISYWLPDPDRIQTLMAEHFDLDNPYLEPLDPPAPANLWISIQDSTGRPRAVNALVDHLLEFGYQHIDASVDWSEPLEITRIIAQRGDHLSAEAVRQALGFGEVRVESTGVLRSDITIQLGQDWLKYSGVGPFSTGSAPADNSPPQQAQSL